MSYSEHKVVDDDDEITEPPPGFESKEQLHTHAPLNEHVEEPFTIDYHPPDVDDDGTAFFDACEDIDSELEDMEPPPGFESELRRKENAEEFKQPILSKENEKQDESKIEEKAGKSQQDLNNDPTQRESCGKIENKVAEVISNIKSEEVKKTEVSPDSKLPNDVDTAVQKTSNTNSNTNNNSGNTSNNNNNKSNDRRKNKEKNQNKTKNNNDNNNSRNTRNNNNNNNNNNSNGGNNNNNNRNRNNKNNNINNNNNSGNNNNNNGGNNSNNNNSKYKPKAPSRPKTDDLGAPPKTTTTTNTTTLTVPSIIASDECLLCCDPIKFYSVGKCNHRAICSLCMTKMRCLYMEQGCPLCKVKLEDVIFTSNSSATYESFNKTLLICDKKNNIYYEDNSHFNEIQKLFDFQCPLCSHEPFKLLIGLRQHVESVHGLVYCDICIKNRKVFLNQQLLYQRKNIAEHIQKGDPKERIKPHPVCNFCDIRFFSDEDLYKHCTGVHEMCFICDRQGKRYQYFRDYKHLEQHFRKEHHLCEHMDCLEKKFIAFTTDLELRTHTLQQHPDNFSKEELRQRRDLTSIIAFTMPSGRGGGRGGFGRIIGRENAERNREESAIFLDLPEFGVSTTTSTTTTTTAHATPTPPPEEPELTEEDRKSKNVELRRKLLEHFKGDEKKLESFAQLSNQYRKGKITATEYQGKFFTTFGGRNSKTISLFKDVIILLPNKEKRDQLKEEERKEVQKMAQYPELSPPIARVADEIPYRTAASGVSNVTAFPSLPGMSAPVGSLVSGDWAGRGSGGGRGSGRGLSNSFPSLQPSSRAPEFPTLPVSSSATVPPTSSVWANPNDNESDSKKKQKKNKVLVAWG